MQRNSRKKLINSQRKSIFN